MLSGCSVRSHTSQGLDENNSDRQCRNPQECPQLLGVNKEGEQRVPRALPVPAIFHSSVVCLAHACPSVEHISGQRVHSPLSAVQISPGRPSFPEQTVSTLVQITLVLCYRGCIFSSTQSNKIGEELAPCSAKRNFSVHLLPAFPPMQLFLPKGTFLQVKAEPTKQGGDKLSYHEIYGEALQCEKHSSVLWLQAWFIHAGEESCWMLNW